MSSSSLDVMEIEAANGPLVEVTLQSLSGLKCNSAPTLSSSRVTAAVSFAGSASDMQVSSSFLCGNTGNIVVESQVGVLQESNDESSAAVPLRVEWQSNEHQASPAASPHLTIRLPKRDQKLPSVPLSKMNRDCNVVKKDKDDDPPSLDESETSSHLSRQQQALLEGSESASEVRGASVVWSASGAGMPDIIELHVSVSIQNQQQAQSDDEYPPHHLSAQHSTFAIGIAHLVFFGSDTGTTVLDLPIKQSDHGNLSELNGTIVSLEDTASLRVKVSVGQSQSTPTKPIKESFLQDMQRLEPILQQLHLAAGQDASNKNTVDDDEDEDDSSASRFLCGSGVGFLDMLKTISGVVKKCDGDGEGILPSSDSMGSTIVTSASLGI